MAALDAVLPQLQCERCGHPGCAPYAQAVAAGESPGRCRPGGLQTLARIAAVLGEPQLEPDPDYPPLEGRLAATIDESVCIGCVKCVLACPVDAIVGAPRHRHRVIPEQCTGCERCVAPCPVDCIRITPVAAPWTDTDARLARERHRARQRRREPAAASETRDDDVVARLSRPDERRRRIAAILESARRPGR